MLEQLANIFRAPDLRKRVLFTLAIIAVVRMTAFVPTPFIDTDALREFMNRMGEQSGLLSFVNMFTGQAFSQMTIGALGIMPYISASIILQLLMVVWPRLEKIAKEGEAGKKKINQYTRYGTVLLACFQGMGISTVMLIPNGLNGLGPNYNMLFAVITMISMTTGTMFLMWLGEKISENGIGNGISIVICVNVMSSYPYSLQQGFSAVAQGVMAAIWLPTVFVLFLIATVAIILIQEGTRRIPIQHARRVVGRRVTQAQTTYLPLKINSAGVIPVIFSSAILSFPGMIFGYMGQGTRAGFFATMADFFAMQSRFNLYETLGLEMQKAALLLRSVNMWMLLYIVLTIFFCFFYTAIQFNPIDVAENLKKSGAFIPGKRPGRNTSDYIDYVMTRITLVGAIFLVTIAVTPYIFVISYNLPGSLMFDFVGGTGLIIVVGVVLQTMKQIESQLMMRHYEGFKPTSMRGAGGGGWRNRPSAG